MSELKNALANKLYNKSEGKSHVERSDLIFALHEIERLESLLEKTRSQNENTNS